MRMLLCIVTVIAAASGTAARETQRGDISGTWSFLVDASGTQNTPTFVFKQQSERLSGTWTRGDRHADVSGTVKGDKAVCWVEGMFPWKEPTERIPLAVRQIRSFLRAHRPAST